MLKQHMNPLGRAIYDKLVDPSMKHNNNGGPGVVLHYDYIKKLAAINMMEPNSGVPVMFYDVPVEDHGRGTKLVALNVGTEVWVTFNSPTTPIITTIFTEKKEKEDLKVHHGPQVPKYLGRIGG